jgi:hypothetical protein
MHGDTAALHCGFRANGPTADSPLVGNTAGESFICAFVRSFMNSFLCLFIQPSIHSFFLSLYKTPFNSTIFLDNTHRCRRMAVLNRTNTLQIRLQLSPHTVLTCRKPEGRWEYPPPPNNEKINLILFSFCVNFKRVFLPFSENRGPNPLTSFLGEVLSYPY